MPNFIEINDLSSPDLDLFARLTEPQLRNRLEPEKGIFIAENPKVIRLALDAGCKPISFLMERKQINGQGGDLFARCGDVPIFLASGELLAELVGFRFTRGVLCAMRRPRPLDAMEICAKAYRVAILENIADATNVGAIFRSAAALHMDAVLLTPSCCDPLCRRSVGVSMGTIFQIPWAYLGDKPADWPFPGLDHLRALGFRTVAMALDGEAIDIRHPSLSAENKLAIVLGAEGTGLSRETITACDYTARIPMSHHVDSLNVTAASAVAFWALGIR